jgi:hypothetical protein
LPPRVAAEDLGIGALPEDNADEDLDIGALIPEDCRFQMAADEDLDMIGARPEDDFHFRMAFAETKKKWSTQSVSNKIG